MFLGSPLLSGALVHAIHLVVRMRFARRPFDRWLFSNGDVRYKSVRAGDDRDKSWCAPHLTATTTAIDADPSPRAHVRRMHMHADIRLATQSRLSLYPARRRLSATAAHGGYRRRSLSLLLIPINLSFWTELLMVVVHWCCCCCAKVGSRHRHKKMGMGGEEQPVSGASRPFEPSTEQVR